MKIFINGDQHEVSNPLLTYDAIVKIASRGYRSPSCIFTVTYKRAADNREGILTPGNMVAVKEGTVINAFVTDSA